MNHRTMIEGFAVRKYNDTGAEVGHTEDKQEAVKKKDELEKQYPDSAFKVVPIVLRRPGLFSVLLKTVVNLRFKLTPARSPKDAAEKVDRIMSGKYLHDIFNRKWIEQAFRDPNAGHVVLDYIEWAEEHQCALVDEERGELDDFEGSMWLEPSRWRGGWDRAVPDQDIIKYLEMASIALEGMRGILADRLDLSDEEMVRLENQLNRHLNPKEEEDGQEESDDKKE